ncbi:MAG: hypothetical protein JO028_18245 [Acidobacteriaceae bacterium]|nr:hypothetical protein [Acidobacteriaceae bacterium]
MERLVRRRKTYRKEQGAKCREKPRAHAPYYRNFQQTSRPVPASVDDSLYKLHIGMSTSLDQYRAAKADYLKLRNQAKKELIARFNELANELLSIQRELLEDFGEKVSVPSKPKKKPAGTTTAAPSAAPSDGRVAAIQKKIDGQKKKLTDLQTAGKPIKTVEDRIYELEDELRLAKEK